MTLSASTFDILVIGAGLAGLSAAVSAAERGARVALLEKTDAIGGSSAMSGGFFALSETEEQAARGIKDSAGAFLSDLQEVGGSVNDSSLLRAYLEKTHEVYSWLKTLGTEFDEVVRSSGQSKARSHHTDIRALLGRLHSRFEKLGGVTVLEHAATRLITNESGHVSGVSARTNASNIDFYAKCGVILATGGFTRSTELLQIFAPDQLKGIPYGGKANSGDGLRMAWRLGAGMADMGYVSGTYGSHPETTMDFHELLTAYYLGAIIVNQEGNRFVDESQSYKVLGRECLKQTSGIGYQIFDQQVRAQSRPGLPLNDMELLESLDHLQHADTIEDLADLIGVDQSALVKTVEHYNNAIAGSGTDPVGRKFLCNGVGDLVPITEGPFYAYTAKTLLTTTFAGITVSPSSEVTDVDGVVIPGLYAAGELTGGFHGAAYMTGTSLGKAAVFGRVAAHAALGAY